MKRILFLEKKKKVFLCRDPLDYFVKILGQQSEPVNGNLSAGCTLLSNSPQVLDYGKFCGFWLQQSGSVLDQFHKKSCLH